MVYRTQVYTAARYTYNDSSRKSGGSRGRAGSSYRHDRTERVLRGGHRGDISKPLRPSNYPRSEVYRVAKDGTHVPRVERKIQKVVSPSISTGPTKLYVSNLDSEVNNLDMEELFQDFGVLKSASINWDKTGRSKGTADVIFEKRADALKAIDELHGRTLDGKALNIQLATSDDGSIEDRSPVSIDSGYSGNSGSDERNTRCDGEDTKKDRSESHSTVNKRTRAEDAKHSARTAEQLDADLDAYMNLKAI
uniref:SFRICE_010364 n=1 Tax=Spodoptera frugiperda TaxID=7108 RepID=A0A2H1VSQ5_SPOFR